MKSPYDPIQMAAPATTPVSLSDAKAHSRIENDQENSLITLMIEAATAHLDGYGGILGRCLIDQTWAEDFDGFDGRLYLKLPARSVTSLTYIDLGGSTQTLSSSVYELGSDPTGSYIRLKPNQNWPATGNYNRSVRVSYVSGYGSTSAAVPSSIRAALLMMIGGLYDHRQSVSLGALSENPSVQSLLKPYNRNLSG